MKGFMGVSEKVDVFVVFDEGFRGVLQDCLCTSNITIFMVVLSDFLFLAELTFRALIIPLYPPRVVFNELYNFI